MNHRHPIASVIPLPILGICLLLIVGLILLIHAIFQQSTLQFDTSILLAIHQWENPLLDQFMLVITRLGNAEITLSIFVATIALTLGKRRWNEALMFAIACAGAVVLNQTLKLIFQRLRPALWPRLIEEITYSFPSGHALGSIVLYGFLAFLLASWYPRQAGWIYAIAVGAIALIGFSRLYLGVHYPTDVLAGYIIGFLWLILCITILRLRRNHARRDS